MAVHKNNKGASSNNRQFQGLIEPLMVSSPRLIGVMLDYVFLKTKFLFFIPLNELKLESRVTVSARVGGCLHHCLSS
jgi:hypothetical protein